MGQNMTDIDRVVDYRREYQQAIRKPRLSGANVVGLCPFHEDRNNSFSASTKTGQWQCFACGAKGNYIDFKARLLGVGTKEAYRKILEEYHVELPEEDGEREDPRSYSLERYAAEKGMPAEWLASEFRLSTERSGRATYLREPYFDAEGREATFRMRFARKELKWKKGKAVDSLYGEWRMAAIRAAGYAVLVEGESDTQALSYMGVPALGVAGANMFKPHEAALLKGLRLYLHDEGDHGGATFIQHTCKGLHEGGFTGKVYRFSCRGDGVKDPSDLLIRKGREGAAAILRRLIASAERVDPDLESRPPEVPGMPVRLLVPAGWSLTDMGVAEVNPRTGEARPVSRLPLVISRRLVAIDTGEEKAEVSFLRDGTWRRASFPRSTVFTARGVTALADCGFTVTSENAKGVVRYLEALEAENIERIPRVEATGTLGWQPGGGFLPGHGGSVVLDVDPSLQGWANAYEVRGTLSEWVSLMQRHRGRDRFRFILAAGLAPPLLRILRQRNFIVYNWGNSKGGKSAALKAALSAWGNPERLMANFNATQVALERMAGFFNDLPMGVDERQLARKQENIETTVYMIGEGVGRARGNRSGGLQKLQTWCTVAIMTGEEPLASDTSQTGVTTRNIEVYGGPFDDEREASKMHQKAPQNCGHAGPLFVGHVMATKEGNIRAAFALIREEVRKKAPGAAGPHIDAAAVVALADAMAEEWIFADGALDKPAPDPAGEKAALVIQNAAITRAVDMAAAILKEQMASGNGDVNERAAQFVVDWVLSNRSSFGPNTPGRCFGFLEGDERAYVFPSILKEALTDAGYSPQKTLKHLDEIGAVGATTFRDGKKWYGVKKRFNGKPTNFIGINLAKIGGGSEAGGANVGADGRGMDEPERDAFFALPETENDPFEGGSGQESLPI